MQLLPWADNCFIRKAEFAKISFKSISENVKPNNMEWDDNKFFNNQFSHPYQGSLYFNAFRSNGYNFWESVPAVVAGSFAWETIFETHFPAPNDLINTSLGGIAFGEMSHRISRKLLSRGKGIKSNTVSASLSFIINPINNVNMLNRSWKKKNEFEYNDDTPVSLVTDAGIRLVNIKGQGKQGNYKKEAFGRIHLQYGDPFADFEKPFSSFSIIAEAGNADSAKTNTLQIEGSLYGRKIKETDHSVHSFTISMKYDFFQNSSFIYGAQSFSANLFSRFHLSKNLQLQAKASAGIIPLAAVPNPYMYYGEGRNYDYCMGVHFQAGAGISIGNRLFYDFNCNAACLKTVDGYSSSHLFYNTSSALRLVIYKKLSVSATTCNYYFNGYYKNYPDVSARYQFLHFGLGYKIIF
jgi:hypothetical protein